MYSPGAGVHVSLPLDGDGEGERGNLNEHRRNGSIVGNGDVGWIGGACQSAFPVVEQPAIGRGGFEGDDIALRVGVVADGRRSHRPNPWATTVSVNVGISVNTAVTVASAVMVRSTGFVAPVKAPSQWPNNQPSAGVASRVTTSPWV